VSGLIGASSPRSTQSEHACRQSDVFVFEYKGCCVRLCLPPQLRHFLQDGCSSTESAGWLNDKSAASASGRIRRPCSNGVGIVFTLGRLGGLFRYLDRAPGFAPVAPGLLIVGPRRAAISHLHPSRSQAKIPLSSQFFFIALQSAPLSTPLQLHIISLTSQLKPSPGRPLLPLCAASTMLSDTRRVIIATNSLIATSMATNGPS
jgi:hypothetical protein